MQPLNAGAFVTPWGCFTSFLTVISLSGLWGLCWGLSQLYAREGSTVVCRHLEVWCLATRAPIPKFGCTRAWTKTLSYHHRPCEVLVLVIGHHSWLALVAQSKKVVCLIPSCSCYSLCVCMWQRSFQRHHPASTKVRLHRRCRGSVLTLNLANKITL